MWAAMHVVIIERFKLGVKSMNSIIGGNSSYRLCTNTGLLLITSVILETFILMKQSFAFQKALKTALGMSFISMISMEVAMNITDYVLTGGAMLTWWVVPIMLAVGFVTPWPYNYWRLKKHNQACH